MIAARYDDPDDIRETAHDEIREVRTRWFGDEGLEVVADTTDGRVITVWRKGVILEGLPFRNDVERVLKSVGFRVLQITR